MKLRGWEVWRVCVSVSGAGPHYLLSNIWFTYYTHSMLNFSPSLNTHTHTHLKFLNWSNYTKILALSARWPIYNKCWNVRRNTMLRSIQLVTEVPMNWQHYQKARCSDSSWVVNNIVMMLSLSYLLKLCINSFLNCILSIPEPKLNTCGAYSVHISGMVMTTITWEPYLCLCG